MATQPDLNQDKQVNQYMEVWHVGLIPRPKRLDVSLESHISTDLPVFTDHY